MIAVVIPCYRVKSSILDVLCRIGPECDVVYVVDDGCPEHSGRWVETECADPRVRTLHHETNRGVGAATLTGYAAALAAGAEIIVRLDGDAQMDPALIPRLVAPVAGGEADYAKGNRFFEPRGLRSMPPVRLLGNAVLSFASKLSSGYWNVFDPTNGFTAIHAAVAAELPFERLSPRYFFESDLLYRLGVMRAVVCDVPLPAAYGRERSSLRVHRVALEFAWKHARNTIKRIFYSYYLRNFNIASIELALGVPLLAFGFWVGITRWIAGSSAGVVSSSGTVMLAALPVIVGVQLVLAFLGYDLQNVPRDVLHRRLVQAPRTDSRVHASRDGSAG